MPNPISKHTFVLRNVSLFFLLLLAVSGLGTRYTLWSFKLGLLIWLVAVLGSIVTLLLALVCLWRRRQTDSARAHYITALASLPGVIAITLVAIAVVNAAADNITQVSTDRNDPPAFVAAVEKRGESSNALTYTEEIAAIQAQAYPDIKTVHSPMDPGAAFERCLAIAESLGWEVYAREPAEGRIEAVDTTIWFGFKDDIAIRVRPTPSGSSLIDLRSASRVGVGDLGVNAKRVRQFVRAFNSQ